MNIINNKLQKENEKIDSWQVNIAIKNRNVILKKLNFLRLRTLFNHNYINL